MLRTFVAIKDYEISYNILVTGEHVSVTIKYKCYFQRLQCRLKRATTEY